MRSLQVVVTLALFAATASAAPHTKTHGGVSVVAEIPAWAMAATPGMLAVVDDGFATASAFDTATGTRAWHTTIDQPPRGMHSLHVADGALLAWTGYTLHVLDPATGKERAAVDAPGNGTKYNDGGCGLDSEHGMCAWRCQCSYQVFDCATGARLGKRYDKTYVELFPQHGPPSAGCWGAGSSTIGRVGGLVLLSAEDEKDPPPGAKKPIGMGGGPGITAAIDVATGKEKWRTPFDATSLDSRTGHSPDGKTCWLGGNAGQMRVVDCASGAKLWEVAAAGDSSTYAIAGHVAPQGVFALVGRRATLYDERTGKIRWRVQLPEHAIGWPRGAYLPLDWDNDKVAQIALLDPATGKTASTIAITPGATLVLDHAGGVFVGAERLDHYGADGKLVAHAELPKAEPMLGGDYLVVPTETAVVVLARADLHEVGRIDGHFQDIVVEGRIGAKRIAMFEYDGKHVGRAVIVQIAP